MEIPPNGALTLPSNEVPVPNGMTGIRLAKGFPAKQAWWTVYRQAFAADALKPVGLYLGTSGGQVWASRNEGGRWARIADHLPAIQAVEAAVPA